MRQVRDFLRFFSVVPGMDRFVRPLTEAEKEEKRRQEVRDILVRRFDDAPDQPLDPKPWLRWDVKKKQKYVCFPLPL